MSTFAPLSPTLHSFFHPDTPEAQAHARVSEPNHMWDYVSDVSAGSLDEHLLALSAAYVALNRYINGQDLYILPNSTQDLEAILRRYSADAIHNYVAKSRAVLGTGGYSRASFLAGESIQSMLAAPNNAERLLALHNRPVVTRARSRSNPKTGGGTPISQNRRFG